MEYKTLPKYDNLWALLGIFIPVPSSYAKHQPDFVIKGWGFCSTIPIGRYKVPLGLIMIIVALLF